MLKHRLVGLIILVFLAGCAQPTYNVDGSGLGNAMEAMTKGLAVYDQCEKRLKDNAYKSGTEMLRKCVGNKPNKIIKEYGVTSPHVLTDLYKNIDKTYIEVTSPKDLKGVNTLIDDLEKNARATLYNQYSPVNASSGQDPSQFLRGVSAGFMATQQYKQQQREQQKIYYPGHQYNCNTRPSYDGKSLNTTCY